MGSKCESLDVRENPQLESIVSDRWCGRLAKIHQNRTISNLPVVQYEAPALAKNNWTTNLKVF